MIWRFRFPKVRMRLRGKARDRQDSAPSLDEVRTRTQQQFHAWAAMVRASVEAVQALAEAIRDRNRALEDFLKSPNPNPAAIDTLIHEIQTRRTEIESIIDALPALDEMGEAGEAGRPGAALPRSAPGKGRSALPSR